MSCSHLFIQPIRKRNPGQSERGQIVVEYVLLLVVAVSIAAILTRTMIGREPGNEGVVISAWQEIIRQIGFDKADDIQRE